MKKAVIILLACTLTIGTGSYVFAKSMPGEAAVKQESSITQTETKQAEVRQTEVRRTSIPMIEAQTVTPAFVCGVENCVQTGEHVHASCGVENCAQTGEHVHASCGVENCVQTGEHAHGSGGAHHGSRGNGHRGGHH